MKPSRMLVSLAKSTIEDEYGEIKMSWGKFVALLGLCGALAVDSVEESYPDGVAEIVETFGIIVEQVMGEWISGEGGGWDGFIRLNVYKARIPPVPRTIFIVFMFLVALYSLYYMFVAVLTMLLQTDSNVDLLRSWNTPEQPYCSSGTFNVCPKPLDPLQYLYARQLYRNSR